MFEKTIVEYQRSKNAPLQFSGNTEHFFMYLQNKDDGCFEGLLLDEGVIFAFNRINTTHWPMLDTVELSSELLTLNICLDGRCEAALTSDRYAIVSAGQMSLGTQRAQNNFYYPTASYKGIEIFFDMCDVQNSSLGYFAQSGIDPERICEDFCCRESMYCRMLPENIMEIAHELWKLKGGNDIGGIRVLSALLIRRLSMLPYRPEHMTCFTRSQIAIAEEAEKMLCGDLSVRRTAKEIAMKFGISESAFKNYFRGVFGKNISEYIKEKRIAEAKRLLSSTNLKISDVAVMIGYENQGKFARVFREACGVAPLEYRRLRKINSLQED